MLTYEELQRLNRAELWAQNAYNVVGGPGVLIEADTGIGVKIALQTRAVARKYVTLVAGTGPYSYNTLEADANTNGGYRTENASIGEDPGNTTYRPLFDRNGRTDLPPGLKVVAEYHSTPGNTQLEQWVTDYHMLTLSNTGALGANVNTAYLGVANTQLNKQNFALTNTGSGFPHSVYVDLNTDISITNSVNTKYVTLQNTATYVSAPLNTTVIQMAFGHLKVSTNYNTTITNCCVPCKPSTNIINSLTTTHAYYRFEESVAPYLDSSGNNRDASQSSGASSQVTGRVGYGRKMAASNNSIILAPSLPLGATGDLDISFWMKLEFVGPSSGSATVNMLVPSNVWNISVDLEPGGDTTIYNVYWTYNADTDAKVSVPNDGNWHWIHAKWTQSSATAAISYDNGTDDTKVTGSGTRTTPTNVSISNQAQGNWNFYFDEILIRTEQLTTTQAGQIYNSGLGSAADCLPIQPKDGGTGAPLDGTGSPGQYLGQPAVGGVLFPMDPAADGFVMQMADSLAD